MVADIEKALKYPLNFKPLFSLGILFGVLFVLLFVPFLLLGNSMDKASRAPEISMPLLVYLILIVAVFTVLFIILSGYMVAVSRSMIAGNMDKAPELTGIGSLFIDGLKFMVIGIVYAIPPVIFIAFMISILDVLGIIFIFVVFPPFFIFHLAGAHLAYTNSLKKALNIPYIYSLVFNHLKGFSLGFIFYFVASIAFSLAALLIVTYPFVIVASYVTGQYILTIFYMESTGLIEEIKL